MTEYVTSFFVGQLTLLIGQSFTIVEDHDGYYDGYKGRLALIRSLDPLDTPSRLGCPLNWVMTK